MFDVGFGELLVMAVVALVVLGPERLPGAARTLGALIRRAREGWNNVRSEVERELQTDELRRQMKDAAQAVHQAGASLREGARAAGDSVREVKDNVDAVADSLTDSGGQPLKTTATVASDVQGGTRASGTPAADHDADGSGHER